MRGLCGSKILRDYVSRLCEMKNIYVSSIRKCAKEGVVLTNIVRAYLSESEMLFVSSIEHTGCENIFRGKGAKQK